VFGTPAVIAFPAVEASERGASAVVVIGTADMTRCVPLVDEPAVAVGDPQLAAARVG
jgi:hypothetical protein